MSRNVGSKLQGSNMAFGAKIGKLSFRTQVLLAPALLSFLSGLTSFITRPRAFFMLLLFRLTLTSVVALLLVSV